jgi:Flp pilus assembly CpaF family ATPase
VTGELLDYRLVRALQEKVADLMTAEKQRRAAVGESELAGGDEQQMALSVIRRVVARHMQDELAAGWVPPDLSVDQRLAGAVYAAMYQAGELQELLEDDLVENVNINGADEVWVTYADGRGKVRGRPVAASDDDLIDIVQNLGAYAGLNARPFSVASPQLDLRLHDGSRLSAIMSAGERPSVSIRRNRYPQMFLPMLVEFGTVGEQLAAFLQAAVLARHNIIVAGATDTGKTTLLRALINCIPPGERLITIEMALELGLRRHPELHPDVVEWEEVLPDSDGNGGITLDALVRRSRRQDPSRVILGEILGPEVVATMTAMSQGNDGSLSTIHARSASDVFHKLSTYSAQFAGLDVAVTHSLVSSSIDFVVFIRKNPLQGGARCVAQVLEVNGMVADRVGRSSIFGTSSVDGRAERDADVPIVRAEELAASGYDDSAWSWSTGLRAAR